MPELLLELGVEELPASFVERAYRDLQTGIATRLAEAGLAVGEGIALGTPRRLIVTFADVPEQQPDSSKEMRGPALKAAFDAAGAPTNALLGFCRSQGVSVDDLRRDEQYVWVTKHIAGRPTVEIFAEALPKAIRALTFDKSMRWGASRLRFARPIRWILATFGGSVVPFDIEGVPSGNESRGHRFYAPATFVATTYAQLESELRARFVEPDPRKRRERIEAEAAALAALLEPNGHPVIDPDLLDENVHLSEWPTAIMGTFPAEYLALPEPVLKTAMAKHERMFPIQSIDGSLTNRFIFIRNSGQDVTVTAGCEWVLNARFNDAKFFHDEDAKSTMDDFLAKTTAIVFQEKLGTVRQRADRLVELAAEIASATGADESETAFARQAARYAKADLASGLVGELSSLQGIIGGEYARREGMPEAVASAIARQYAVLDLPAPQDASDRTTYRLILADQLDKLAGYLGLGLEPTGSSDPFALRRAATSLITAAWRWDNRALDYNELLSAALAGYARQGVVLDEAGALAALADLFTSRYSVMLNERYDLIEAALLPDFRSEAAIPAAVAFRLSCLKRFAEDVSFVQTATRPLNIVAAAKKKGIAYAFDDPLLAVSPEKLESESGVALWQILREQEDALFRAVHARDLDSTVQILSSLAAPINAFFEGTMIMAEDPDVRFARLSLLHACSLQLLRAGDFSRIVIEG